MPTIEPAGDLMPVLQGTVLFAGLSDAELRGLAACSSSASYAPGTVILRRGDPGDAFFVVAAGRVQIELKDANRGRVLDVVGPGAFFGELALLDGSPRSADVVALEDTTVAAIGRDAFLRFVEVQPRVADRLVTVLRERLPRHAVIARDPTFADVPARLAQAIEQLAAREVHHRPVLEVLPVVAVDGRAFRLRPPRREALIVDALDVAHPRDAVIAALGTVGVQPDVVHSTSWRFEAGRLVLTYIAVVPDQLLDLERVPVHRRELARGGATTAPHAIEVGQVVEHALRHLAWLRLDDPAVAAALPPGWRTVLEAYEPEPFRALA